MTKTEGYSVKREIMNAVTQLMKEKSYMDISVTDIVKKAGVARASFYRNFNSINDVIDAVADHFSEELLEDVIPTICGTDERKWREFLFNHFYLFRRRQKEMESFRFENMDVIFSGIDNRLWQKEARIPSETIRDKYLVTAKLGLINSITKQWMDTGAKESPEEMVDYIMSFITKF